MLVSDAPHFFLLTLAWIAGATFGLSAFRGLRAGRTWSWKGQVTRHGEAKHYWESITGQVVAAIFYCGYALMWVVLPRIPV